MENVWRIGDQSWPTDIGGLQLIRPEHHFTHISDQVKIFSTGFQEGARYGGGAIARPAGISRCKIPLAKR